jgi:hypothetical protein
MSSPLCPHCRQERLNPEDNVPDRMIGDVPATYLRCDCGHARWYQVIPRGDNRLELVEAPHWWQEWSVLAAAIALIVVGTAIISTVN